MSMKVILCAHAMHTFCPHFDYFSLDGHTAPALFLDLLQEEHLGKVSKLQLLLDLHTPPMWHRKVEYPVYKHRHNEGLSFLHAIWRGGNRHKTTPLPLSSLPPLLSPLPPPPSPSPTCCMSWSSSACSLWCSSVSRIKLCRSSCSISGSCSFSAIIESTLPLSSLISFLSCTLIPAYVSSSVLRAWICYMCVVHIHWDKLKHPKKSQNYTKTEN